MSREGLPIALSIRFPAAACEAAPALLALARRAPEVRISGNGATAYYEAAFGDLTASLGPVIELVGEAQKSSDALVTVNGRTVSSITRFWSALLCYRESLGESDPHHHCLRHSARLNQFSGCPDQSCLSPCQFICTRCLGLAQGKGEPALIAQLKDIARQAEVDWCPNLKFSNHSGHSGTR